jgi:hypothetical protein
MKTAPQQCLQTSSPNSHPPHHTGGSLGPMAPSPTALRVSRPSSSMAQTPTPASPATLTRGGASLAEHQAATVLQCWKGRIWLRRWFDQQALLKQKRLHLQALCRGASTYASSVRGNCRPPPTLAEKTSDRKVLRHPFRTRGRRYHDRGR